jgi:hypothetical protein
MIHAYIIVHSKIHPQLWLLSLSLSITSHMSHILCHPELRRYTWSCALHLPLVFHLLDFFFLFCLSRTQSFLQPNAGTTQAPSVQHTAFESIQVKLAEWKKSWDWMEDILSYVKTTLKDIFQVVIHNFDMYLSTYHRWYVRIIGNSTFTTPIATPSSRRIEKNKVEGNT